eukprot:2453807-Amphidinium_carterae.1
MRHYNRPAHHTYTRVWQTPLKNNLATTKRRTSRQKTTSQRDYTTLAEETRTMKRTHRDMAPIPEQMFELRSPTQPALRQRPGTNVQNWHSKRTRSTDNGTTQTDAKIPREATTARQVTEKENEQQPAPQIRINNNNNSNNSNSNNNSNNQKSEEGCERKLHHQSSVLLPRRVGHLCLAGEGFCLGCVR